jgi:hypothetical protein
MAVRLALLGEKNAGGGREAVGCRGKGKIHNSPAGIRGGREPFVAVLPS